MSKKVIGKNLLKDIQENIEIATLQLDKCKQMLDRLNQDFNRLTVTDTISSKKKKSTKREKNKKPKIEDLVISRTRPNTNVIGKIIGCTAIFLIVTPEDKKLKPFRKAWYNLADLSQD